MSLVSKQDLKILSECICMWAVFVLIVELVDNKAVCDDYNQTTTAEVSSDDEPSNKRPVKRKRMPDFVTGVKIDCKHLGAVHFVQC